MIDWGYPFLDSGIKGDDKYIKMCLHTYDYVLTASSSEKRTKLNYETTHIIDLK